MNDTIQARSFDKASDTQNFTSEQFKQIAVDAWKGIENLPRAATTKTPSLDGDVLNIPPLFEDNKLAATASTRNHGSLASSNDVENFGGKPRPKPHDIDPGHNPSPDKCHKGELESKPMSPSAADDWAVKKSMIKAIDALPGSENLDSKERKQIFSMLLDNNEETNRTNRGHIK